MTNDNQMNIVKKFHFIVFSHSLQPPKPSETMLVLLLQAKFYNNNYNNNIKKQKKQQ